ncbi:glucose-1-phosphate adenylyltransferase subunit GlgD [Erysipelatoclostridium sp. An173]|uniref:glucose-1-phosphate adenylyltransferase subunit GlgD n=1 Tax=Erysipelatoclostridium sp. An173 TaxID=1965571 RepID=UPI000B365ED1|nr:glucose-1-phosphate adenylyltransferase subunit GlgD [Erysipelatoclostridium sp. An173]OUP76884.1 glucose-1-phosphate adenylyltransferase subunit GlgD [Erysipelatoclostridium sp. An173]
MVKVIGVVNLHSDVDFVGLTERRPAASVSFLGRYALIDFVLSNMSNSTIDAVGVLIQKKPRSLLKHLGNGNSWNFNSKAGGVSLLYNEKYANNPNYNHDINNLIENIAFLESNKADYVVVAPAHIITTMNYNDAIESHEKSGAEITMVYKKVHDANEAYIGCDCLTVKNKTVTAIEKNRGSRKDCSISMETYVFNTKTLLKVMKQAQKISSFFSLRDVLAYLCDEKQINAYEYKGYARCMDSLEHYYQYSLEFLDLDVSSAVFKSNWPIYTNTNDTPPAKYLSESEVVSSFVANGAMINGTVENSIIGRDVTIGTGAVVKNSILFSGSVVSPGAHLENVIMDKHSKVKRQLDLKGDSKTPLYIKEGDVV